MTICLVGDSQELTCVYVGWLAQRRGIKTLELWEDMLGVDWHTRFSDSDSQAGHVTVGATKYRFDDLTGAFVRMNPHPALPDALDLQLTHQYAFISERRAGIQQFVENLRFTVANRPSAGRSNNSKPYQMRMLTNMGFQVPTWIATNDVETATDFANHHPGGTIYKSCSGLRSRVRRLDQGLLFRLRDGASPVIIQEFVAGRDVRVHTVHQRAFATEVLGGEVDYRFEHESNYRPTEVPDEIVEKCYHFAQTEGTVIAGFDFRVTEGGVWYCLEMNPVPSFLSYEMATGQQIGDALLDSLTAV
jgi:glutathione synthase/RimK-type ligase-like ATP-grasp enzyme